MCFYRPEVASVGLTEAEAAEKGIKVRVNKFSYLANGKALALGEREGWVKLVAAEEGGRIIGAQIFGTRAAELIAEATLAISHGLTAGQLASLLHAHPTLTEAVMEAAVVWLALAFTNEVGVGNVEQKRGRLPDWFRVPSPLAVESPVSTRSCGNTG